MYVLQQRFKIRLGSAHSAARLVEEDLLPKIKEISGFSSFYMVDAGDRAVAVVGLFETQEGADQATRLCRQWFRGDRPAFQAVPPELLRGEVLVGAAQDGDIPAREPTSWPHVDRRNNVDRRWGGDRRTRSGQVLELEAVP